MGISRTCTYYLIALLSSLIALFYGQNGLERNWFTSEPSYDLVVGILSARNHFRERDVIRRTWLKKFTTTRDVKSFFIIGNRGCDIPIEHRRDPFSCERLVVNYTDDGRGQIISQVLRRSTDSDRGGSLCNTLLSELVITVNWDILIEQIGVYSGDSTQNSSTSLLLINALTDQVIVELDQDQAGEPNSDKFAFVPVEPKILLPKGYVAIVRAKSHLPSSCVHFTSEWEASGLISYSRLITQHNAEPSFINSASAVNIVYSLLDQAKANLFRHFSEYEAKKVIYAQENEEVDHALQEEISANGDILVVDMVDVYRNLPQKLLLLARELSGSNFRNLLKLDDDCFVNAPLILSELNLLPAGAAQWWGSFRELWALDQFGKWAELKYRSVSYPPFACGSGYVLSAKLVKWLSDNAAHLKNYQGEDVSLGIWMAALDINYVNDIRWRCQPVGDIELAKQSLVIPQLTVQQIEIMYDKLQE